MQNNVEIIQINISGEDKPGMTSSLTEILARYDAFILDIGQAQGMLGKMIMDAMEDLIGESYDSAKTEQKVLDKVNRVADKARELAQDLGRKVTPQELAQESGLTQRSILEAYRLSGSRIEDLDVPKDA